MEIHCDEAALKGITGKGVGVAVLDTGIYLHEDLKGKIQGFKDFVHGKKLPYDDNGHGTHIAAMIAGSGLASGGLLKGIAPGSSITAIKVLDHRGNGYAADVLMGLRWDPGTQERIWHTDHKYFCRIPYQTGNDGNSALVKGVNAAWDDGLVVVVAAGNHGPAPGTVTTPGISRKVITVGCSDDDREVEVMGSRMVDYSGRRSYQCLCVQARSGSTGLRDHQLL